MEMLRDENYVRAQVHTTLGFDSIKPEEIKLMKELGKKMYEENKTEIDKMIHAIVD